MIYRMKNLSALTFLLALLFGWGVVNAADNAEKKIKEVKLPIETVTVYEDRALVTRAGEIETAEGQVRLRIVGLPPMLTDSSLRASLAENSGGRVIAVSSRTEQRLESVDEKVKAAEKECDTLNAELRALNGKIMVLGGQETYLESFERLAQRGVSERVTTGEVKPDQFGQVSDFLAKSRARISGDKHAVQITIDKTREKLNEATLKLMSVKTPASKMVRFVDIDLEMSKAGKTKLSISYIIMGAYWTPRYEARLQDDGKFKLNYLGEIRQRTGEDWTKTRLVLSTARPSRGVKRPPLNALTLRLIEVPDEKKVADISKAPVTSDPMRPTESSVDPGVITGLPEAREARTQDLGTSVVFEIEGTNDIPGDGRSHKVHITSFSDEKPELSYETVPKMIKYAYLKCKTANRTTFPFLPGDIDVFRGAGFIGTSSLVFTSPGQPLTVFLGIDGQFKVKYNVLSHKTLDNEKSNGRKNVYLYHYKFEITNFKKEAETINILDQVPVADIEEVVVEVNKTTTPPSKKDDKTGLYTWTYELKPGEKVEIELEFNVKMPKNMAY